MKHDRVIAFEPRERILAKAKQYVDSVETFLEDGDQAMSLLLKAMKLADDRLKHEIMVVLGSFAKEEIAWPLVDLMTDASESEEVRHNAAIQLSDCTVLKELSSARRPLGAGDRKLGCRTEVSRDLRHGMEGEYSGSDIPDRTALR